MEAALQPTSFSHFAISAPHNRTFFSSTRGVELSSVSLVVALHIAAFLAWISFPPSAPEPLKEMAITIAIAPPAMPEVAPPPPPPPPKPVVQPRKEMPPPEPKPAPVEEPVAKPVELPVEQPAPPPPVVAAAPAPAPVVAPPPPPVQEVEPDYKASYLNNPRPPYPFAARRMGLQGKVILNVEVLAKGISGQVNVHQSSGHEMLDNAAVKTVKTWKFVPARRGEQTFTKWFKIPIQFSLNNNES